MSNNDDHGHGDDNDDDHDHRDDNDDHDLENDNPGGDGKIYCIYSRVL